MATKDAEEIIGSGKKDYKVDGGGCDAAWKKRD